MRVARFLLLSLLGVAAVAVSAFMAWVDDRSATDVPLRDLLGFTGDSASLFASVGLVLLVVAAVGLVATIVVSRKLLAIAGLAGLVVVVVWIVQAYLDDIGLDELGAGPWVALGGSALMLLATWLGRAPRRSTQANGANAR
jgi:hypothetical protein